MSYVDGHSDPDDLEVAARLQQRYTLLGTDDPKCGWPGCSETNPFALLGYHPDVRCYAHDTLSNGRWPYESHHVAGRHNSDAAADVPINDHRILSEMQTRTWPFDTLVNPDRSPLLVAAAAIRGWVDVMRVIIDRAVAWIPVFLEWVDEQLVTMFGPQWWRTWGWEAQP